MANGSVWALCTWTTISGNLAHKRLSDVLALPLCGRFSEMFERGKLFKESGQNKLETAAMLVPVNHPRMQSERIPWV